LLLFDLADLGNADPVLFGVGAVQIARELCRGLPTALGTETVFNGIMAISVVWFVVATAARHGTRNLAIL